MVTTSGRYSNYKYLCKYKYAYISKGKYLKGKLTELKKEINNLTIIIGDFNISLLVTDRTNRKSGRIQKT